MRVPLGLRPKLGAARASGPLAAAIVIVAVGIAVFPLPGVPKGAWQLRAMVATALVGLSACVHHALGKRRPPPKGWLVVDGLGVHRLERGRTTELVDWGQPFGVTVLTSPDRAAILLALTQPGQTRYLGAAGLPEDAAAAPRLFERAATAADADVRMGDQWSLSAADAERFVVEVARRAPGALDRVYLSDAAGQPIVLDRGELHVGGLRVDLGAPLEWRASYFQEIGAHAASICQATWVRQGDVEFALVAPAVSGGWLADGSPVGRAAVHGAARAALARDLALLRATASEPPARELRHAIDRVFVVPLRRALDRAPRSPRVAPPPSRRMPEGRA